MHNGCRISVPNFAGDDSLRECDRIRFRWLLKWYGGRKLRLSRKVWRLWPVRVAERRESTVGWLTTTLQASISTYFLLPTFWQPSKLTSVTLRKECTTFLRNVVKHYRDFRFSQRYWRLISYVTWCVAGRVCLDVTQDRAAFVFRVKQPNICLTLEMQTPRDFETSGTTRPMI